MKNYFLLSLSFLTIFISSMPEKESFQGVHPRVLSARQLIAAGATLALIERKQHDVNEIEKAFKDRKPENMSPKLRAVHTALELNK